VIRWGSYFDDYSYSLKSNIVEFSIHIIIVYGNIFYLIPKLILRKRYKTYIASMIAILTLVYLTRTGLNLRFVTTEIYPEAYYLGKFFKFNYVLEVILGEIYVITFVTSIKLLVDWFIEKKRNESLAKLQLSTELKFLRSQIQPHFFFNTLNNLYALTLKKSDDAPRLVIKLSDLMQYVLYEVNSSNASLLKEINHINNYIDIEHIRFKDRIKSEMDITGDIEDVEVPPLLFLSFIENCFKHGLKGNDKIKLTMSFEINSKGYLEFHLKNSFNPNINKDNKQGIGIANSERRLKLLFGNNFILESRIEDDTYNLFLKIPV
jgi:sensor histidine kinase YesM